ncbi:MAG: alpha/beta hydrolase-fold protein [Phormidesmis sp.]
MPLNRQEDRENRNSTVFNVLGWNVLSWGAASSLLGGILPGGAVLLEGFTQRAIAAPLPPAKILPQAQLKTAEEIGPPFLDDSVLETPALEAPATFAPIGGQTTGGQTTGGQTTGGQTTGDQITEITEPDGTTVILPPGFNASRQYPALVLMPYTDRSALHMFNWGIYHAYSQRHENGFVVIMPPGQGSSANWSGPGWQALVDQYEAYIQWDLDAIAAKHSVDPNQMVIGGFSLGGDLSWTLSLRNPGIFSGAIVMSSMSSYRDDQRARQLAARNFRYFMVMGGYDGNRGSMFDALDALDQYEIDYHYEEVSSAGHGDLPEQMQSDLFLAAMDYVLSERFRTVRR